MNIVQWSNFFVAGAGAGSALAGLIIVAMSANIRTILTIPSMTSRAATTIAGLVLIVVISCAGLIPEQPARALGVEIAVASTLALVLAARSAHEIIRTQATGDGIGFAAGKAALGVLPNLTALVGGLLLCASLPSGLYTVATAIIVTFATSVTNAWVLLVEILR